jgi:hypothetical protein
MMDWALMGVGMLGFRRGRRRLGLVLAGLGEKVLWRMPEALLILSPRDWPAGWSGDGVLHAGAPSAYPFRKLVLVGGGALAGGLRNDRLRAVRFAVPTEP